MESLGIRKVRGNANKKIALLSERFMEIKESRKKITIYFLGANAPLGPASSEGLYVCLSVCLYVCNTLAPLPFSPSRL